MHGTLFQRHHRRLAADCLQAWMLQGRKGMGEEDGKSNVAF